MTKIPEHHKNYTKSKIKKFSKKKRIRIRKSKRFFSFFEFSLILVEVKGRAINCNFFLIFRKVKSGKNGCRLESTRNNRNQQQNKSNTINNKKQQKQHEQQEKTAHNKKSQQQKMAITTQKSNNSSANMLEGQKWQLCVFHTTTGAKCPECGEQIKAKRCGFRRVLGGGEREGREELPMEIRWNLLRSKTGLLSIEKNVINILEGQTTGWTFGCPKAATSTSNSNKTTSNKKSSRLSAERGPAQGPRRAGPEGRGPKFRAFFFSSPTPFSFFLSLSGRWFRGMVFWLVGTSNVFVKFWVVPRRGVRLKRGWERKEISTHTAPTPHHTTPQHTTPHHTTTQHNTTQHNTTHNNDTTQREIPHKVVLGNGGSMAQKTKYEQQIVPKSSPASVFKDDSHRFGHKTV